MTFAFIFPACIALKPRSPTGKSSNQPFYYIAFVDQLVAKLETPIIHDKCGFVVIFREIDTE